jgi:hypothetical protein
MAYLQTRRTNLVYGNLAVGPITVISELKFSKMLMLYITNTFGILFSLGLRFVRHRD